MGHNLTERQQELARWLVSEIESGRLTEEFGIAWTAAAHGIIPTLKGDQDGKRNSLITEGNLQALVRSDMLLCSRRNKATLQCVVTNTLYDAVKADFGSPDTSFLTYLRPLTEDLNLDEELKRRCLPLLSTGGADPILWDSAVRAAGVILEERLRDIGGIADSSRIGRTLVNDVFGAKGTLSDKFENESELLGYRDLYAGIIGAFRNPSAHRIIDPSPEDGGAIIIFVNLLLGKLEQLR